MRVIMLSEDALKSYSSREIIRLLTDDGWYLSDIRGDHHQFKHPIKKGKITVTHPKKRHADRHSEKHSETERYKNKVRHL